VIKRRTWWWRPESTPIGVLLLAIGVCHAAAPPARFCLRAELQGEVSAGQEWKAALGQSWILRVLPIAPSVAAFSGWDLVIDRDPPAGYPDALLLATLPYNSINEREIGTTFGLRAQDAVGWNPRSFRFLTNPADFTEAQQWFRQLTGVPGAARDGAIPDSAEIMRHLLRFESGASSGQLRILDAHIVPGTANPQPFAQAWAVAFTRTQHEIEPVTAAEASPLGRLLWMRFALTLWFPARWNFPPGIHPIRVSCPE
jgi:hypothetical protein